MARVPSMLDTVNENSLASAESLVRRYCGWHIAPVIEETLTPRPAEGGVLYLPTMKMLELVALSINGRALGRDELDEVWWDETGMLERPGGWPARPRAVTVTIRHGYELDEVGDVAELIRNTSERNDVVANGLQRVQVGNRSSSFATEAGRMHLTPSQKDLLQPFVLGRGVR